MRILDLNDLERVLKKCRGINERISEHTSLHQNGNILKIQREKII